MSHIESEVQNLLYQIFMLENDIKILSDMNKALAWTVKERDDIILELKDQIRYMREMMPCDEMLH